MRVKKLDKGVAVFTAVKNRESPLKYSLPSWINCRAVNQIVLIDWGCDTPLIDTLPKMDIPGYPDKRIIIGRCESPYWKPSHAFNLAISHYVNKSDCLKLDADVIVVDEAIFNLDPSKIHMNYWANNTNPNKKFLSGSFFTATQNLWDVGGYDERFSESYGYEDDDLYNRIEKNGIYRVEIPNNYLYHLPHTDSERFDNYEDNATNPDKMWELARNIKKDWGMNDSAEVKYTHKKIRDGYYLSAPVSK